MKNNTWTWLNEYAQYVTCCMHAVYGVRYCINDLNYWWFLNSELSVVLLDKWAVCTENNATNEKCPFRTSVSWLIWEGTYFVLFVIRNVMSVVDSKNKWVSSNPVLQYPEYMYAYTVWVISSLLTRWFDKFEFIRFGNRLICQLKDSIPALGNRWDAKSEAGSSRHLTNISGSTYPNFVICPALPRACSVERVQWANPVFKPFV